MMLSPATMIKSFLDSSQAINIRDRLFDTEKLVQAGHTPYDIIYDDGLACLRHYTPPTHIKKHKTPLLIVAPLAVNMLVYDLFKNRSMIKYLLSRGFSVYLIDWGCPNRQHAHLNFERYIIDAMPNMVQQMRQHSGEQEISIHGWSMAGTFALLYAAYSQDPHIRNLIILGSPIDAYASGSLGRYYEIAGKICQWTQQRLGLHPRQLPAPLLHTPGWANALTFKFLDPVGTVKSHWKLLKQLHIREAVEGHATLGAFLDHMVDYPGGINRDNFLHVWLDNPLKNGQYTLEGQTVYLKNINASLLIAAGHQDNLVTADAMRPLIHLTKSTDVAFTTIPGGHVGMISGQGAASEFWPLMADWLAKRSD